MYLKKWLFRAFTVLLMIFMVSCGSKTEEETKKSISESKVRQQKEVQKPEETEKEILFVVKEEFDPNVPYGELNLSFKEIRPDGSGISEISPPVDFSGNYSHKIKDSKLDPSETSYYSWKTVDEKEGIITVKSLKTGTSHNLNWKPDEFSDAPKFKKPVISPDGSKVVMYSEKDNIMYLTDADGEGKDLKKIASKPEGQKTKIDIAFEQASILDIKVLWLPDSSKFICYETQTHLEEVPWEFRTKEIIDGYEFTVFDNSGNKSKNNFFPALNTALWIQEQYPNSSGFLCITHRDIGEKYESRFETKYVKLTADGKIEPLDITKTTEDLRTGLISPDCSKMVFSDEKNIWTVGLDGSEPVNLTDTKEDRKNYAPVWSPDGKKIAFASDVKNEQGSQSTEIWIMDTDGKNKKKLASEVPYSFILLAWGKAKVEN